MSIETLLVVGNKDIIDNSKVICISNLKSESSRDAHYADNVIYFSDNGDIHYLKSRNREVSNIYNSKGEKN